MICAALYLFGCANAGDAALPPADVNTPNWGYFPVGQSRGQFRPMKVLTFYDDGARGEEFSNLHKGAPITVDPTSMIPTDGAPDTLLYNGGSYGTKSLTFPSSEHLFQAAKAARQEDALFIMNLDGDHGPGLAAKAGGGRLNMKRDGLVAKYKKATGIAPKLKADGQTLDFAMRPNWDGVAEPDPHGPRGAMRKTARVKREVMLFALRAKFTQHPGLWRGYDDPSVFFVEHTTDTGQFRDRTWADGNDGGGTNCLGKLLTALVNELKRGQRVDLSEDTGIKWWLDKPNELSIRDGQRWYQRLNGQRQRRKWYRRLN